MMTSQAQMEVIVEKLQSCKDDIERFETATVFINDQRYDPAAIKAALDEEGIIFTKLAEKYRDLKGV